MISVISILEIPASQNQRLVLVAARSHSSILSTGNLFYSFFKSARIKTLHIDVGRFYKSSSSIFVDPTGANTRVKGMQIPYVDISWRGCGHMRPRVLHFARIVFALAFILVLAHRH